MATTDESTVPRHPIGVVAERTRLSQDVLRVWERRYQVVEPGRSESGQRLYSDADIERLRLLSQATATGRSIRLVAGLPTPELARMVREDEDARRLAGPETPTSAPAADVVEPALELAIALDGTGLHALLWRSILSAGLPAFIETVATPLLIRIGDEWHAGRLIPAQEHLASAIVQRVMAAAMNTVIPMSNAPNLVIATPAGERHEIGAVLAAAAAAAEGWRVTYLGADLPASDIADAAIRTGATAVGLSIVYGADRQRLVSEITTLRVGLPPSISLLLGGAAATTLAPHLPPDTIRILPDLRTLRDTLRTEALTTA